MTLATGEEVGVDLEAAINAWIRDQDAFDSASQALDWLKQFEQKGLLGLPLARRLLPVAREGLAQLPPDNVNTWDFRQQLAAHLALAGDVAAARELIAATDPGLRRRGSRLGVAWPGAGAIG